MITSHQIYYQKLSNDIQSDVSDNLQLQLRLRPISINSLIFTLLKDNIIRAFDEVFDCSNFLNFFIERDVVINYCGNHDNQFKVFLNVDVLNGNRAQLLAKFEASILDLTVDRVSGNVYFTMIDDGSLDVQLQCVNNHNNHVVHSENHDVFVLPIIENQVDKLANVLKQYLSNINNGSN